jgi:hypothetical protein
MTIDNETPRPKRSPVPEERHLSARELKELTDDDPDKVPLARAVILEIMEWSFYFLIIFIIFAVLRTFFSSAYESLVTFAKSIGQLLGK